MRDFEREREWETSSARHCERGRQTKRLWKWQRWRDSKIVRSEKVINPERVWKREISLRMREKRAKHSESEGEIGILWERERESQKEGES